MTTPPSPTATMYVRPPMRSRRRTVLAVIGIAANLVGIAGLTFLYSPVMVLGDTTTTMMWIDGCESTWVRWALPALAVAGVVTVVVALWSGGEDGAGYMHHASGVRQ